MDYTGITNRIDELSRLIEASPCNAALLMERAKLYRRKGDMGAAMNDFIRVAELDPENREADSYIEMLSSIFEYRYTEIYNV